MCNRDEYIVHTHKYGSSFSTWRQLVRLFCMNSAIFLNQAGKVATSVWMAGSICLCLSVYQSINDNLSLRARGAGRSSDASGERDGKVRGGVGPSR